MPITNDLRKQRAIETLSPELALALEEVAQYDPTLAKRILDDVLSLTIDILALTAAGEIPALSHLELS